MAEQRNHNPRVRGSSPCAATFFLSGQYRDVVLIKRFEAFCKTNQLFTHHDFIIIALSGGMDSVALLHLFLQIKDNYSLHIEALHVNHNIRGEESERDEQFVRQLCAQWDVPLTVERLDLHTERYNEETLRTERYRLFERVLQRQKKARIATAHTLNDQVETVLMRLAGGSSLKGLSGIPVKRQGYIRPLLFATRDEVKQYVQENKLNFVEDSSNKDFRYLRNRVRKYVIPALQQAFGTEIYAGFAKSTQKLEQYYRLFEREAEAHFQKIVHKEEGQLSLDLKGYIELDQLYRKQILASCICSYYPLNYTIPERYFDELEKFIAQGRTGAVFHLENDVRLLKDRHRLLFYREPQASNPVLRLNKNSEVRFGKFLIAVHEVHGRADVKIATDPNEEYICGDRLTFPLVVRSWQPGDRFFPLGMSKSQKVKAFFVNQKIARLQKSQIPIVCNGNEIVWIVGFRLDDRYKVEENCKKVFKLTVKETKKE